ncbi:SulP family inorganic anion transporter [Roseomonas fluvialis]|uniref:DNA repair protein HhH-GPD n=1 Tax=Roseomonas fluvialis TaxID=1750527 RepID=A0ABN6P9Y0_9PROT|nr:SulP family inorganic anion transporter [Roseomonas fluvialis]BDG74330.1 DNA repair protein HhH-GPD [Roseomonas fluvialis]
MSDARSDEHRLQGLFPPLSWLRGYSLPWLRGDLVAGVTLAAYAVPVALAYATLAGLPPQVGVYGYILGGIGYALLGSSRHLAIGPTSAISLMLAANVGAMAGGDPARYAAIASLAAFAVALLCLVAWALRLSVLTKLISDSILVGFKAGAGITIAMTQLPALSGVAGGGQNVIERAMVLVGQVPGLSLPTLAVGLVALGLLVVGGRVLPGRPVALAVVALSILVAAVFDLADHGVRVTGLVPSGLPEIALPALRLSDVEGIFPLAAGILLLAYIEGISAARSFAEKHGYALNPRQEFLGIGAANLLAGLGQGYPVAGGLSQSAVAEKAGSRTPLALILASVTLGLCLLFLTGLLANLPKAVLAAVVLTAVAGLIDIPALIRLWRVSRPDFAAAAVALTGVLLFGILQGILLAALASVLIMLVQTSRPHVAFLGRVPGTSRYGDMARHPENEPIPGVVAFRPEGSLLYVNAEAVLDAVVARLGTAAPGTLRLLVCDLSAAPHLDLAATAMLRKLHAEVGRHGARLAVVGAHGTVRDLLRREGLADLVGDIGRASTLESVLDGAAAMVP